MINPFKASGDTVTNQLYFGIWLSIACLMFVEYVYKDDAQIFQVVASVLTGFLGAFLGRVKPAAPDPPPPGTVRSTSIEQVTSIPSEPKETA